MIYIYIYILIMKSIILYVNLKNMSLKYPLKRTGVSFLGPEVDVGEPLLWEEEECGVQM